MASTDMGPEGNIGELSKLQTGSIKYEERTNANLVTADFNAVEAVVDATHRYHGMFYDKEQ